MCDYSLMHVKSRAAAIGDKIITTRFANASTKGFSAVGDCETAVCVLPGTEIAFEGPVQTIVYANMFLSGEKKTLAHTVAIFRQVDKEKTHTHHDALEFPDGTMVMLHTLAVDQRATVLQLPAQPKNETEAQEQKRLEVVA